MHLNVVTTLRCNLRCPHCIYGCPGDAELEPDAFRSALDGLVERDLTSVTFTGGEPALHPGLGTMVDDAVRRGLAVGFVTNGWRQDDYDALLRRCDREAAEIAVSLDGVGASHDALRGKGSFRRAVDAVRRYAGQGFTTTVNFTVRNENVMELGPAISLSATLGAHAVKVAGLLPASSRDPAALAPHHRRAVYDAASRLGLRYGIPVRVANSVYHPVAVEFCPVLTHDVLTLDAEGHLTFCCDVPHPAARLGRPGGDVDAVLRRREHRINEILLGRILTARDGSLTPDDQSCLYCHRHFGALA